MTSDDDDQEMKTYHNPYQADEFCINQNNKFMSRKFIPPQITTRKRRGAQRQIANTRNKAYNSTKSNHRTPITFATKALFCAKVEQAGMSRIQAWKWMKNAGYQVGRSSGGCHKWAAKGSHYWMSLIAKYGDHLKFSCIISSIFDHLQKQ